jgi:protein-tyrosine phosphatase
MKSEGAKKEKALTMKIRHEGFAVLVLAALAWNSVPTSAQPLPQPPPGGSLGLALGVATVPNLRDMGGYQTRDGAVVARGLVYRSDAFVGLSAEDIMKIEPLGLKNDYDLRVAAEAKAAPDELPANVRHHLLNVMADLNPAAAPDINGLLRKPKEANVVLGDGKVEALFIAGYREFVTLPSAKRAYRTLFISLANRNNLPAVFHCASGKDRTGWAAAALLTLLGVPKETVMADYMRTNEYTLPQSASVIDGFVAGGGDRAIPEAIIGVRPAYLEASFDEMQKRYGSIEGYFAKGLGINAAGQKALRDRLLRSN